MNGYLGKGPLVISQGASRVGNACQSRFIPDSLFLVYRLVLMICYNSDK